MNSLLMILPLLAPTLVPAGDPVEGPGPFEMLTFDGALEKARIDERMVFIDFYTEWCGPCKRMDRETWPDAKLIEWLGAEAVSIKVDADIKTELRDRYRITGYPTLLFLDCRGYEKGRMLGFRSSQDFLAEAREIKKTGTAVEELQLHVKASPKDPQLKLQLAKLLEKQSDFEQATDLLLWTIDFRGAEDVDPLNELELSDAYAQLKRVAKYLGRAREEVLLRWQIERLTLLGEKPTPRALQHLLAIDTAFGMEEETLAVFDELLEAWPWGAATPGQPSDPGNSLAGTTISLDGLQSQFDPRPQLFERVLYELVRRKRYAAVLHGFGDPLDWFRSEAVQLEEALKRIGVPAPTIGEEITHEADQSRQEFLRPLKRHAGLLYQVLLATPGQEGTAKELGDTLLQLDPRVGTWKVLMRNARAAGRKDVRDELFRRGLDVLPQSARSKLSVR